MWPRTQRWLQPCLGEVHAEAVVVGGGTRTGICNLHHTRSTIQQVDSRARQRSARNGGIAGERRRGASPLLAAPDQLGPELWEEAEADGGGRGEADGNTFVRPAAIESRALGPESTVAVLSAGPRT